MEDGCCQWFGESRICFAFQYPHQSFEVDVPIGKEDGVVRTVIPSGEMLCLFRGESLYPFPCPKDIMS